MKQKVFCYLTKKKELKKKNFIKILNFYNSCTPKRINFYILDFSKLLKDKTKLKINKSYKKFNYLEIDHVNSIKSFFKDKNAIICGFENIDLESAKVQFLLSKFTIKRLFVSDLGFIPSETGNEKYKIKEKIFSLINLKIPYYLFRFLCVLGFIKNIEYFFESSQNRINQINSSISKKLLKILGIDLSYYRNIYRINSKGFDQSKSEKLKTVNIVYCDSGFDHPDKIQREGIPKENDREKYYLYLFNFLKKISLIYKKKIIFVKHPKNFYPKNGNFLKIKNSFQIVNAGAEKHLLNAHIAIFHVSTLITRAMQLRKKIILIQSNLVGNYLNSRSKNWIKNTKLYHVSLAKTYNLSQFQLSKSLDLKLNYYEKFLKQNSYINKNLSRNEQIKLVLKKNF